MSVLSSRSPRIKPWIRSFHVDVPKFFNSCAECHCFAHWNVCFLTFSLQVSFSFLTWTPFLQIQSPWIIRTSIIHKMYELENRHLVQIKSRGVYIRAWLVQKSNFISWDSDSVESGCKFRIQKPKLYTMSVIERFSIYLMTSQTCSKIGSKRMRKKKYLRRVR